MFSPADAVARTGKVVVAVDYVDKIKLGGAARKERAATNAVLSAGYVDPDILLGARYQRLVGN